MTSDVPPDSASWTSIHRAQAAVQSLALILGPLPDPVAFSDDPASSLLCDPEVGTRISSRLRRPRSGAGGDDLCRWLYDTFQSTDPALQLVVLNFVPTIAGVYLTRALSRKPQAGFEAVLLALYAHETISRGSKPQTVIIPNITKPSLYHEVEAPARNKATEEEVNVGVLSPALEPHGTVRATKRARIVGVALELYFSKIALMPISSKLDFCEFCIAWSGHDGILEEGKESPTKSESSVPSEPPEQVGVASRGGDQDSVEEEGGRIPLPWELFQPILRILGHCLLGPSGSEELKAVAFDAVQCLHARAMHEMNPQAILASRSLLRLVKMAEDTIPELSTPTPTPTPSSSSDHPETEALDL